MTPANSRPVPSYGASELKRLSTNSEVTVRRSEEIDLIAELEELGMQGMAAGRPVVIPRPVLARQQGSRAKLGAQVLPVPVQAPFIHPGLPVASLIVPASLL